MVKKRLVGMKILGWTEIIIGALGTFLLLWIIPGFIPCLIRPDTVRATGCSIYLGNILTCLFVGQPFLWAGIGTVREKTYGRIFNLIVIIVLGVPLVIILVAMLIS